MRINGIKARLIHEFDAANAASGPGVKPDEIPAIGADDRKRRVHFQENLDGRDAVGRRIAETRFGFSHFNLVQSATRGAPAPPAVVIGNGLDHGADRQRNRNPS